MKEIKWNEQWKFWEDKDSFALVWDIPEHAKEVTLPHDAMIGNTAYAQSKNGGNTGFLDAENYTYVKMFTPSEGDRDKILLLKFEGVYMNALVYVNGQLAGKNPNGYTDFYVKLNDFLKYGIENEIRVQVRAGAMSNSRWYSGAGIYRDVYLLESGLVHIRPQGVMVTTENADESLAVLSVNTELSNEGHTTVGSVLATEIKDNEGNVVASERTKLSLFANETRVQNQRIAVENPKLWSEENPYLYTVTTRLFADETGSEVVLDESSIRTGIRTLQMDAKRGLRVNGKCVKLRGACIHHDSGLIGAATYDAFEYRRVKCLKEAGFNAIRMSHHPMAPAMLRACDELGVYVMDETFDMWNRCKSDFDYGLYFEEWWERDVAAMVRKDFNHPSVILYSVGNEIPEIGTDLGAKLCHAMSAKIKSIDPNRFTTAGINGVFAAGDAVDQIVADVVADLSAEGKIDGNVNDFMTLMDGHLDEIVVHPAITERLDKACAGLDVAGYNYMTARYEGDAKEYPNRVMVGSETYPPEIARNWQIVKRMPQVIGDFTWTGWDYRGEAGVGVPAYQWGEGGFGAAFPCQLAYAGDIDITGVRRPVSYYREIVFGHRSEPYIAVQNPAHYGEFLIKTPWVLSDSVSSWSWMGYEGKPVIVEVYSPGAEVELFCNGNSLGKKPAGEEAGYRVLFETTYEPGMLTAVAYDADGKKIGTMNLETADGKRTLLLTPERLSGGQDAKEFALIHVTLQDASGNVATDADTKITLQIEGDATVFGFGSGNPKPMYGSVGMETETFCGRAQIILKRNQDDEVKIKITAEDGKEAELVYAFDLGE